MRVTVRSFCVHTELPILIAIADTETGPGVYETALAYTTALRMADNAQLFKFSAKSIGMKYGIIPSFMAKPWGNVRRSVVSCPSQSLNQHLFSFRDAVGASDGF